MKDEIKEIDIKKDCYLCSPLLNTECSKENCYINNGPCCHTVNKEHSQQYLLDYITNLQEENERLKEKNVYCNRTDCVGRIKDSRKYDSVYQEKEDYKTRNEKAIELINKYSNYPTYYLTGNIVKDLLNILQGKSDE